MTYVCDDCGRMFERPSGIARHRMTHDGPTGASYVPLEDEERMIDLYVSRGLKLREVAERVYWSPTTVWRVLKRRGIARRRRGTDFPLPRLSVDDALLTARLYGDGYTMAQVADLLGITIAAVHYRLHREGVPIRRGRAAVRKAA